MPKGVSLDFDPVVELNKLEICTLYRWPPLIRKKVEELKIGASLKPLTEKIRIPIPEISVSYTKRKEEKSGEDKVFIHRREDNTVWFLSPESGKAYMLFLKSGGT